MNVHMLIHVPLNCSALKELMQHSFLEVYIVDGYDQDLICSGERE